MMRFLTVVTALALISVGLDALPDCPNYDKCVNPTTDLCQKVMCYLVPGTLLSPDACKKFMVLLGAACCNGSTMTDITNNFMSMASKCLPLTSYTTALSVCTSYSNDVKKAPCNSSMSAQMTIIGKQFNTILGPLLAAAVKLLAPYKGKCSDANVYPIFAKYACGQGTPTLIQKLITALKGAQGANCWPSAPRCLSPKALQLNKYAC